MITDRLALIRRKHAAFDRLYRADLEIAKRRKRTGEVPSAWLEKRARLLAEYRAALEALNSCAAVIRHKMREE